MKNNSFVMGAVLGALAVGLIWLLSGGWGGMMGPGWNYGMMGPCWGMFFPTLYFAFLAALAIWVAQNQGKKK